MVMMLRTWIWFVIVRRRLRRSPLPVLIKRLEVSALRTKPYVPPDQLSALVSRGLRLQPLSRRCLPSALVLYRLLAEQGDHPQLVIGLRENASDATAHAWVEIEGRNIGPSPVERRHIELARYG